MSEALRLLARLLAPCVLALVSVASASSAPSAGDALITVRVDARDFAFTLSRKSVAAGATVRFVVRNRGATRHDFAIRGRRTRLLEPGERQTITLTFPKKGGYSFLCTVPGHARLGMRGTFGVALEPTTTPSPPPPPPSGMSTAVTLTRIGGFERPVLVAAPPGDVERLFVVDQTGAVWIVRDGRVLATPFLDLRGTVKLSSEPGLLSIAFAPDYAQSGRLYVDYNSTQGNGDLRISEFRRDPGNPDIADRYSERILLTIPKPWENHNGGMLQFGPDGYLYASVGDGDSGVLNPPGAFAQRRDDLLGDILRIDPLHGAPYATPPDNPFVGMEGIRSEVWAYGLRNPWRFWIDPVTGSMFIGDVGNERREEIDLIPRGRSGMNFGWPCFEGSLAFDQTATCDGAVAPLLDYPRSGDSCAVIGGVVARDPRMPELTGHYLFGDLCSGRITSIDVENGQVVSTSDLRVTVPQLTSFGVDALDRIYVMSLTGDVFRLDPKPAT